MTFVSPGYPAFLAGVVLVHRALPPAARSGWLLLASAVFYGWGSLASLLLLVLMATSDAALAQVASARHARAWAGLAAAKNLGGLLWFQHLAPAMQLPEVMPLGFAFYALQSTGYVLEVAAGRMAPRKLGEVMLFVSFFPQLVAGPIERAQELMPQLAAGRVATGLQVRRGVMLLVWGAFQKLVIADTLAPWVDRAFAAQQVGGALIWGAAAAFMVQVYADLAGYTDLARGSACLLGIELSRNFDAPWRAASTPEFWSRWHRTVTRFAREHLLAPLLGPHPTPLRRAWATLLTLVLLGAWHGAGWNFLVFGLLHGLAWTATLLLAPWAPWRHPWLRPLFAGAHLVLVGWTGALVFREPDIGRLYGHLTRPFWISDPQEQVAGLALVSMAGGFGLILVLAQHLSERWPTDARSERTLPLEVALVSLLLAAIFALWRPVDADFLYFQF
jgi:alginate O-acetyltransferase complex protein AlgI